MKFEINMVVIEGCDLAGKSSLFRSLHKETDMRYNIHDRSSLTCLVCAQFYGRDVKYFERRVESQMRNLSNVIILLHPAFDEILRRYAIRGDELHNEKSLESMYELYNRQVKRWSGSPNVVLYREGSLDEITLSCFTKLREMEKMTADNVMKMSKNSPSLETGYHFELFDEDTGRTRSIQIT